MSRELRTEPRAIVFDLDGTLVNSMPMVLRAFAHALAPFRAPLADADLFLLLGAPPLRTFREILGDESMVPEAMRRMGEFSRNNWTDIQPFGGVHRFLEGLRSRGRELALWTGRDRRSAEMILQEHLLAPSIGEIVCGDDLPSHKPDPEGLETIIRRIGVTLDETLYVGDADVDVLAGAKLGVRTLLIRHGRCVSAEVESKAWKIVETAAEAYAEIETLSPDASRLAGSD